MPGLPSPRLRIAALSPCSEDGSDRHSSLPFLLRLALLVWMNGSLIQPPCPLSLFVLRPRSSTRDRLMHVPNGPASPRPLRDRGERTRSGYEKYPRSRSRLAVG